MANIDYLNTAVYLNKESQKDEQGNLKLYSRDFNQILLDPYKSFIINTAGRLKTENSSSYCTEEWYDTNALYETIKTYIITSVTDVLMSCGAAFIDVLHDQFLYGRVDIESHYEFEYPFSMITKNDEDIVEKAFKDNLNTRNLRADLRDLVIKYNANEGDITIQRTISIIMDGMYATLLRTYFDKMINKIATFYINTPEIIDDFYISFLDKQLIAEENSYNNSYNFVSLTLRDMVAPYLEKFKDCLFVIGNTVSSMIMGYTPDAYKKSYDEFIRENPFAYELLVEKYGKQQEESIDEDEEEL